MRETSVEWSTVRGLQPSTARTILAYNLSVDGIPTYHVGRLGLLVHNVCNPNQMR